ncbi:MULTISPECIES: flippase [Bacteroidales]|uniref:flippase n=1 Tax=Parabacteroides distasonis TaxID=823 RepID=UPI0001BBB00E|nr:MULTISPECIES: flippase [Bacteroidales]EEY84546.1 polysaccharide biosynthesis protein [Bacteroides sp. 2_1_33B]
MSTDSSIKKNFAYKSALTISTYLMNFITFPYVSRVLEVEGIGLVSFVDNTVNYFLLFATMGINLIGVREIAATRKDKDKCNQTFSNIFGLNFLFTVVALIVYIVCVSFIPQFHQYEELFYIGTAKILFTTFLVEWFFTGLEDFRYITVRSLVIKFLYVVTVFICICSGKDYKLYFALTVAVVVINAIINMVYVRNFVRFRFQSLLSLKYVKQNLILGIYSIMTSMYLTFNVMYLGFVSNNTEVGYYTTAFKLYSVILGLFTAFTNVMLPRMSSLLAEGEQKKFQSLINKSFSVVITFCIPLILCSMILAPQIVYVLSGSGYEGAILPMRIIMPAILFVGIAQVLAVQVLMPMKKDKVLLIASVVGAIVSLLINLLMVPYIESVGSAVVLLCSEAVVTGTYLWYVLSHKLTLISVKAIVKSVLYSLPSVVVCWGCGQWIENEFVGVGCAVMLAGIVWMIIQVTVQTSIGKQIKNML